MKLRKCKTIISKDSFFSAKPIVRNPWLSVYSVRSNTSSIGSGSSRQVCLSQGYRWDPCSNTQEFSGYMFKDMARYLEEKAYFGLIKLTESFIHLTKTCGLSNTSRLVYYGTQHLLRLGHSLYITFLRKNSVVPVQETLPVGIAVTWLPCYCPTNRL